MLAEQDSVLHHRVLRPLVGSGGFERYAVESAAGALRILVTSPKAISEQPLRQAAHLALRLGPQVALPVVNTGIDPKRGAFAILDSGPGHFLCEGGGLSHATASEALQRLARTINDARRSGLALRWPEPDALWVRPDGELRIDTSAVKLGQDLDPDAASSTIGRALLAESPEQRRRAAEDAAPPATPAPPPQRAASTETLPTADVETEPPPKVDGRRDLDNLHRAILEEESHYAGLPSPSVIEMDDEERVRLENRTMISVVVAFLLLGLAAVSFWL